MRIEFPITRAYTNETEEARREDDGLRQFPRPPHVVGKGRVHQVLVGEALRVLADANEEVGREHRGAAAEQHQDDAGDDGGVGQCEGDGQDAAANDGREGVDGGAKQGPVVVLLLALFLVGQKRAAVHVGVHLRRGANKIRHWPPNLCAKK